MSCMTCRSIDLMAECKYNLCLYYIRIPLIILTFNRNGTGFIHINYNIIMIAILLLCTPSWNYMHVGKHAYISFERYATTVFSDNTADYGEAIAQYMYSSRSVCYENDGGLQFTSHSS